MTRSQPARQAVVLGIAIVAGGGLAFGLLHVVVGGFLNGNAQAAAFGITLAAVSGGFLLGLAAGARRRRRSG